MNRERMTEIAVIAGIAVVIFLFFRRGGTPAQQASGQIPLGAGTPQPTYGPGYLSYNYPKTQLPTNSAPTHNNSAANGNLATCAACDQSVMFGTDSDFAKYLSQELSGVWVAYKENIMAMSPDWFRQYFV